MALPDPLPDNPSRWQGWRDYDSENPYERLCLDAEEHPTPEQIEEHCRKLLVWWQKKLPLKNQPSNPLAQMLRGGIDEAPILLAEARATLLDPEKRKAVDAELAQKFRGKALEEFTKLLEFAIASGELSEEDETNLFRVGTKSGFTETELREYIDSELVRRNVTRKPKAERPLPSPASSAPPVGASAQATPGDPFSEFRRVLRMSRLDDGEMTDDQRDALCNIGESLGLTGGQAEDLIDEYLEEVAAGPASVPPVPSPSPSPAPAARPVVHPAIPPAVRKKLAQDIAAFSLDPQARAAERATFSPFTTASGIEMLFVPTGLFLMGGTPPDALPNELPQFQAGISRFYIAKTPVTNAQYEKFDPAHRTKRAPWADDHHPVVFVTSLEAIRFCEWLSAREKRKFRLPTEAEWEFAARGADGRRFPWGDGFDRGDLANFADASSNFTWRSTISDGYPETSPVGSYPRGASPFGCLDMAGNVWEWCLDFQANYTDRPKPDPRGPARGTQRACRGGSWKSRPNSLRASARVFYLPNFSSNDVGFRVVCECT